MRMGRDRKFTTSEQALAWMAEEFGDVRSRLDPVSLDALAHYKGPGFEAMNGDLRDGVVDRFTPEQWLAITDAIASDRLSEPVAVFRGIAFAPLAELVLDGLEEIGHDGFVSVSLLEAVSIGYLSDKPRHTDPARSDFEPANLLLSAALPIGTHVAPIQLVVPGLGETVQEAELLLHAGSTFVVDAVDDSDLACVRVAGRWTAP
jgi:hypothetical protein